MSTGHVLLGLLATDARHGYDLKRSHDELFPSSRPVAFGQIYATLARLQKKGHVEAVDVEKTDGPERTIYGLTQDGRDELAQWLESVEEPAPFVSNPLALKATMALLAADADVAASYLSRQRTAHVKRMRHYTAVKTKADASLSDVLAADFVLAHLDADLRWLETAIDRIASLEQEVAR